MRLRFSKKTLLLLVCFLSISAALRAQDRKLPYSPIPNKGLQIEWSTYEVQFTEFTSAHFLQCSNGYNDQDRDFWPVYSLQRKLRSGTAEFEATLKDLRFETLTEAELALVQNAENLPEEISLYNKVSYVRKQPKAVVEFIPLRKNATTGDIEKLVSFDIDIVPTKKGKPRAIRKNATVSALNNGDFYKIGVVEDGIYRIDYDFLNGIGIDLASLNPDDINVYGNGFGLLPEKNSSYRPDDLILNRIKMVDGGDGSFDQGDYLLFYAKGPHVWRWDAAAVRYAYETHHYSDTSFYFIGLNTGETGRIGSVSSTTNSATHTVTTFEDYLAHEIDSRNLVKSGREWYGEEFDIIESYSFNFTFPDIDLSAQATLRASLAAYTASTTGQSDFNITVSGSPSTGSISIDGVGTSYIADAADIATYTTTFTPNTGNISVNLNFDKYAASSKGWLNFLEVTARRNLRMGSNNDVTFRDMTIVGSGNVADYTLEGATNVEGVWEITNPSEAREVVTTAAGSDLTFRLNADSLREFIAFTQASYKEPVFVGTIPNQNLHALEDVDYIMITHPTFLDVTNDLAAHRRSQGLSVEVVTTNQVYNEFSSGMKDITAIKDFMKMLYVRAGTDTTKMPDYLLLVGDGSYDNKNRIGGNTAFIPTYQSPNSYSLIASYVSDDYFGLLDTAESSTTFDKVDVGIGRLPVKTVSEARLVVDKIIAYDNVGSTLNPDGTVCDENNTSGTSFGDWRNIVSIIADDEDSNAHLIDAEWHSNTIEANNPEIHLNKIYFDAYKQESTPGGERYPDVAEELKQRVQNGALIINYIGHGGEVGWAHERILDVPTIQSWTNIRSLPLFFTATCEFSRYDDPGRTSAGEYVLLNEDGGGVALMSTTRLVFSSPNSQLNNAFYNQCFLEPNGERARLGTVNRIIKNQIGGPNQRNFSLLGDPATQLAYPWYDVETTTINGQPIGGTPDTLKALSHVTITGFVKDKTGAKITDFNGVIYPTVFDKASDLTTLGQNSGSNPASFSLYRNIIYKGKVSVVNGDFTFSFIVPKDISYRFGPGKISYYAENSIEDAHGYNTDFIVGGTADSVANDQQGPTISLYINNTNFVEGGMTDENPILLAEVFDENGINTLGNGIGHDITVILDENTDQAVVLNDFYEADLNTYKSGEVRYPFSKLSEGSHTLRFKVWDVYNNSSEATTEFVVSSSATLALDHVLNYPNPFTTNTSFYFEHNQVCEFLDVKIDVFTVGGNLVKTIHENVHTDGFKVDPIHWDGRDSFGDNLGRGVYVYRVKVLADDGSTAEHYEKLVILK